MLKQITLSILLLSTVPAFSAGEVPASFNLSGTLYSSTSGSTPLEEMGVEMRVQIMNSARTCILYDERQLVNTDTSHGRFSIEVGTVVGDGKRVSGSDPGNSMAMVFQNSVSIPATCGGSPIPAVARAGRYIRVIVTPQSGVPETLTPEMFMGSTPSALVAETLSGLPASSFLQLGTTTDLTQANFNTLFDSTNYPKLTSLISGSSPTGGVSSTNNYVITADSDTSGGGAIQFAIGSTTQAQITNAGDLIANQRIGIGTLAVTPTHDLSFGGTSHKTIGLERSSGTAGRNLTISSAASGAGLTNSAGGDLVLSSGTSTGTAGSKIVFQTPTPAASGSADNSPLTKMVLDALGYLGIGTSNPDKPLHITSGTSPAILLENTGAPVDQKRRYITGSLTGDMAFGKFTDNMGTTTEHMRLLANGNLGVGVTNPGAALEIKAGTSTIAPLKLSTGTNLLSPVDGTFEFDGTKLMFTIGGVRLNLAGTGSTNLTSTNFSASGSAASPGFSVSGDSDTGIFSPALNTMSFAAGGVEALRLHTAASAVNYLDITPAASGSGPVIAAAGADSNVNLTFAPKGSGVSIFRGQTGSQSVTLGGAPMFLTRGADINGWVAEISSRAVAAGEFTGLKLSVGYAEDTKWSGVASVAENTHGNNSSLAFYADEAERMRISSVGYLGIGTSSPSHKLTLLEASAPNDSASDIASFSGGSDPTLGPLGMSFWFRPSATGSNRVAGIGIGDFLSGRSLSLTNSNGVGYHVGIGTLTPSDRLDVNGGNIVFGEDQTERFVATKAYGGAIRFRSNSLTATDRGLQFGIRDNASTFYPAMTVADGGNVGVGLTNPSAKFQVEGAAAISGGYGSIGSAQNVIFGGAGSSPNAGSLSFGDGTGWKYHIGSGVSGAFAPRLTIVDDGRVGVGIESPNSKLHVVDDTNPIFTVGTSILNRGQISLGNNSHGLARGAASGLNFSPLSNDVSVFTAAGSIHLAAGPSVGTVVPVATAHHNGFLGVSTVSPETNLHVFNHTSSSDTALKLSSSHGSFSNGQELRMDYAQNSTVTARQAMTYFGGSDWGFNFYTFNGGLNPTPTMSMRGSGNVGIGVSNPEASLHVQTSTTIDTSSPSTYGVIFRQDSSPIAFGGDSSNAYIQTFNVKPLVINNQGNNVYITPNAGDVGIGTLSPSAKLHVVGNIYASGTITPSDLRLKKNISVVKNSLQKILTLKGVNYDWKEPKKHSDKRQLGLIAQDVKRAFPEAVTQTNDGFLAVSYSVLIAPAVNAIKELYQLVSGNSEEIEKLKARNAALEDYICKKDPQAPFCE